MTYLPKSELVGVLSPSATNPRDIGGNIALVNSGWKDLGNVIGGFTVNASANLGNGIAIVGIANAPGDIWRSTDYGATWSAIGLGLAVGITIIGYIGNGIAVLGDSGNIFRSTDFGLTWTNVAPAISPVTIQAFAYLGNGIVLMGDALGGRIFRSTDYGANWISQGIIPGATAVTSISYLDNGIVIFTDSNGHVFRSTDYGAAAGSWTDLGAISGVLVGSLSMENGIVIVFGNFSFRSTDYGATWYDINLTVANNWSTYIGNGIATVGDTSGHIFKTTNFGLTWTDLGIISPANLRGMSYLGNGVTIVGDTAGHIFRNEVGYKIDEAQVLLERPVTIVNADITVGQSHSTILVDSPGANRIVTLANPASLQAGHEFTIKKVDPSVSTVTISPIAGTIDGAANYTLTIQWQSVVIKTDGTDWFIVAESITSGQSFNFAMGQLKPNVTRYTQPGWMIVRDDDTFTMTGGYITYVPIFVASSTTFTDTIFNVAGGGGGGSTMDIRIFTWNDGLPDAELVNVGTIATTGAGTKTITNSYTLNKGFYFVAFRNNLAVTVNSINWSYPVSCPIGGMGPTTAPSANFGNWVGMYVNSAYADPAPAPTAISINFPAFKLREN